ncbi:hypothetical protein [Flavobacterium sp.]|uniref:hypothetical protein n=1 Tax=Flavobacterium sp. TaxID=239 RepID=UPI002615C0ED|nr:hypothetical protein [Flavobacterium sp.]
MSQEIQVESKSKSDHKIRKLILSIIFDAIGMMSYIIPGVAEITDIIWAPIGAFVLSRMYKGSVGKIGAAVEFVEEIVPGLDIIPTFTLTWFYEYYIAKKNSK